MTFLTMDRRSGQLVCNHPHCDAMSEPFVFHMGGAEFPKGWVETMLFDRPAGQLNHLCPEHAALEKGRTAA